MEGTAAQKPKGQASAWQVKGQGRERRVDGTDHGCLKKGYKIIMANTSHGAGHVQWFSTILIRIVFFFNVILI